MVADIENKDINNSEDSKINNKINNLSEKQLKINSNSDGSKFLKNIN